MNKIAAFFNVKFFILFSVLVFSLLTLSDAPTVFIDEFWIAEGSYYLATTGHWAIKSFRNSVEYVNAYALLSVIQAFFIKIFDYNLFSIRLISVFSLFFASIFSLKFIQNITHKEVKWYWYLLFLFNPLIWHSSHIGRPEALTILIVSVAIFVISIDFKSYQYAAIAGFISGFGFYVHIPGIYAVLVACSISFFFLTVKQLKFHWQPMVVALAALFSLSIYLLFINSIYDLQTFLNGEIIVIANRKKGSLLKILSSYPLAYYKYIIHNIVIYIVLLPIICLSIYKYKAGLISKVKPYLFLIITAMLVLLFFMVLGRGSRLYFVNIEYWLLIILITLLVTVNDKIVKYLGFITIVLWGLHIALYSMFFPKTDYNLLEEKMNEISEIKNSKIIARIQYQGVFYGNEKYLSFEDFGYLHDYTKRNNFEEYANKNELKYLVIDEQCSNYSFESQLSSFITHKCILLKELNNKTVATRYYDSVPFSWPYKAIFSEKKDYKISIYQVK